MAIIFVSSYRLIWSHYNYFYHVQNWVWHWLFLQRDWYDQSSWHTCWPIGSIGDHSNTNLRSSWDNSGKWWPLTFFQIAFQYAKHANFGCFNIHTYLLIDSSYPSSSGGTCCGWGKFSFPWGDWTTNISKVWILDYLLCNLRMWILDKWFGLDFIFKVNRTKPNRMLFYLVVRMTFTFKTEPNRTANTPTHMCCLSYQACGSAFITCERCCQDKWQRQHLQGNNELNICTWSNLFTLSL